MSERCLREQKGMESNRASRHSVFVDVWVRLRYTVMRACSGGRQPTNENEQGTTHDCTTVDENR